MSTLARIPKNVALFVAFLINTNKLQLSILTPPSTLRYTMWGWSSDESDAYKAFASEAELLYPQYSDHDKVNSAIRNKMKTLIINVNKYDHDPTLGHKLLDRVALMGSVDDCKTFNIKRSTTLAKVPIHGSGDPLALVPRVSLKLLSKGIHWLDVDDPTLPGTKARPKGVLATLIFCCIGTTAPTSSDQFHLAGAAIRGRYINYLTDGELAGSTKKYVYYCACYLTTTGKLGSMGNVLAVDVVI